MFPSRSVADYAAAPLCMGRNQTLEEAARSMRTHAAQCVVVVHRGRPVGVVNRQDLALIDALSDLPSEGMTVQDAMMTSIYQVDVATPVGEVIRAMAAEQQGVAVVIDRAAVRGVFTAMDGVEMLATALAERGRRRPRALEGETTRLTAVC
jgi:CBS domain-containing protein